MRIKFANASRQFAAATLVDDLLVPATGGGDAHHGCPLNNARFQNRTIRYRPVPANFGQSPPVGLWLRSDTRRSSRSQGRKFRLRPVS